MTATALSSTGSSTSRAQRQVFTLPDLGEGLTEAELVRWLVRVGDTVSVDAAVAEVETAKATVEVPTPFAGVVAELHGAEGGILAVGAPLISIDQPSIDQPPIQQPSIEQSPAQEERAGSGNVLIGYGTSGEAPGPRRRRVRPPGSTRPAARPEDRQRVASPIVRQLARRRGLDLSAIPGSGPDGMVTRADVERASAPVPPPAVASPTTQTSPAQTSPAQTSPAQTSPAQAAAPSATAQVAPTADPRTGLPIRERIPVRGMRRATTETLTRSRREIPDATTWVDVDATALLELRSALGTADRRPPGLLAMIARFVVAGLARFPELNARVSAEPDEIQLLDGVNLGIATQTDRGLVVPAVRGAHRRSILDLDAEIGRLTSAARDGTATTTELTSGSFTLNNYGVLGVDGSSAIINHPEVAILGVGRIVPRPWVVDGEIVPRHVGQLSLVFDHRVCDGGTAGGFLRFVADAVETPLLALADL